MTRILAGRPTSLRQRRPGERIPWGIKGAERTHSKRGRSFTLIELKDVFPIKTRINTTFGVDGFSLYPEYWTDHNIRRCPSDSFARSPLLPHNTRAAPPT